MALFLAPAIPWIAGGVASVFAGTVGWFTGFLGSDSIKNLLWVIVLVVAIVAIAYVWSLQ